NKSYDPLLLRVAAFKKTPLPVYVIPKQDETMDQITAIVEKSPTVLNTGSASFEARIPWVKMVDFQEFLETPGLYYQEKPVSPLNLIEMVATTQSAAHFDQRVPCVIEGLKDTPIVFEHNTLKHYVVKLAELTVKLGHLILND
ncbi:MAG: hypothetical protein AB1306_06510, partial [Nitrospirota bacterium]